VFAFDGNSNTGINATSRLWQVSFTNPQRESRTVPSGDLGRCNLSADRITGTPVIDRIIKPCMWWRPLKRTAFYFQRLHALSVTTGAEQFGGPVVDCGDGEGNWFGVLRGASLSFDPFPLESAAGAIALEWRHLHRMVFARTGKPMYTYHGWVIRI